MKGYSWDNQIALLYLQHVQRPLQHVQSKYGVNHGMADNNEFGAGEPIGVLATTAMSNPAYKPVLDSSPSSNSSWEIMKMKSSLDRALYIYYKSECCDAPNLCLFALSYCKSIGGLSLWCFLI